MRRDVPDPWATAMIEANLVYAKRPSIRALARKADIPSSETVRQMIHGESRPDIATVNAVADALRLPRGLVGEWVGQARTATREWHVPDEIQLLTPSELDAIAALILAIAAPRKGRAVVRVASGSGKTVSVLQLLQGEQDLHTLNELDAVIAAKRAELMTSAGAAAQDEAIATADDQREPGDS